MTVQLPSEIVVERVLPTIRSSLAVALEQRGFTQREIADRLGVSQAAVSQYLSGDRTGDDRFARERRLQETVERIADGFADGTMDDYEALAELLAMIRAFEDRGPICAVHEEEMPALQGLGCDLCVRGQDRRLQAERDVLENVRRAVRTISNAPAIVDHVPNVGTNVAMALPDAADATDVAAVPGRIHAMRGQLNVPANPEFGASQHVATTVLAAAAIDPSVRAGINLATSDSLLEAARERGLDPLEFDPDYEDRHERLRSLFSESDVPRVLYHDGAFGIEPITYVLGETAVDAVETAVALTA
ncbi:thiamine-phosphate synthase family protein [Natrialbaceae archaeon AArc-T1-2]|uniref:thiamine-phosphate synthase family protein n=1 Tax=Natrialbaceae archaeon AArc-T1-2 TaxID=3053904 RepID=UPI00255AA75D|nr:thiamine-phosphate synthase family protein [Natrialbaceae archaeon AArc-T1-2]WIV68400.1 thiamine-phosphate synthase family protein [Natrialbaceae archaeon AArc-T1-2]